MTKSNTFWAGYWLGTCMAAISMAIFSYLPIFSPPESGLATSPAAGPAHLTFSSPSEPGADIPQPPAQYIIMDTSGYDTCDACCAPYNDGITASGVPAVGRICAAPPEYPFGTVLDVEGYGRCVVQDRGGAIKGNKLDLLFSTHAEAKEFGRKNLKVRIAE